MTARTAQVTVPRSAREARPVLDPWLMGAVLILLGFGIVMVYSAAIANGGTAYLTHHAINVGLGLALLALLARSRADTWRGASRICLVLALLLLVLVLIPGIGLAVNGSRRWIGLGPTQVQASEFAKVLLVIYFADYFARRHDQLRGFKTGVGVVLGIVAVFAALMLAEPDLGSTIVLFATVVAMMFLAGVRFVYLAGCAALGMAGAVALTVLSPYRLERVTSFLKPFADPFDSGFQLVQALIAFGRGGWTGAGLGASIQKLHYLPFANTDFIMAVVAEELGVVGVMTVIVLFGVIAWRVFVIAHRALVAGDLFGARLAQGLGVLVVFQALINMGVNMGVLPTKGLTLPLMSYGGSSMLASCAAIGLVLMVDRAHPALARARR